MKAQASSYGGVSFGTGVGLSHAFIPRHRRRQKAKAADEIDWRVSTTYLDKKAKKKMHC